MCGIFGFELINANFHAVVHPTHTRLAPNGYLAAGTKPLSYDEVFGQSSSTNCTVYCGNLAQGTTEEALQKIFGPYGQIQEIRVFKDKGYAFIR